MAYLDRIDRYRHEIVAALSREFCAFKMARSTKRAFRRHSSHSSSTTESATMPEPTPKTADPSLAAVSCVSRRVLIATLNRERQPPLPPSSCPAPVFAIFTTETQSGPLVPARKSDG